MKSISLKSIKLKIILVSAALVVYLAALLFRGYQLHILDNARILALAKRQYQATLPIQPKRGTIYDRNGRPLAMDVQVASVAVHPAQINNREYVIIQLSRILGVTDTVVRAKVESQKSFEWITRRVSDEVGQKIGALKLDGVVIVPEFRRFYPNKELAGQVLGAVGYDAKALGGVELSLDSFLKSNPGSLIAEKDAKGRLYTPLNEQVPFNDVHLTLDVRIQHLAEKYLWETADKYRAKNAFAIVMNPQTGEILSMANYPSFNPNSYWEYDPQVWVNHAVADTFEPGSTFKTILAAAAIESGKINAREKFYCENGQFTVGRHVIHDHKPYQQLTLADIIRVSSNIGAAKASQRVGRESLHSMIVKLGYGKRTHLPVPLEEYGSVRPPSQWREIDLANVAFGQGISVTGVQMVQAYASFALGGLHQRPRLLSRITSGSGQVVLEMSTPQRSRVIKETTARSITEILKAVVAEGGTGHLARLPDYAVAGKTGTAQKVDPKTRTYDPNNFVSSFIGYAPADQPRWLIYVVLDSPRGPHTGGVVAAPVFRQIAEEALVLYGDSPQEAEYAFK